MFDGPVAYDRLLNKNSYTLVAPPAPVLLNMYIYIYVKCRPFLILLSLSPSLSLSLSLFPCVRIINYILTQVLRLLEEAQALSRIGKGGRFIYVDGMCSPEPWILIIHW